ncbi:MAG TPA: isochorismatase family protein [Candidatus Bathyarchaeia archaeon]|nr:isochorismatase family protein [Candidatus Bathyarchaeia archaeon]
MVDPLDIYREQQFGARVGFGRRPAVLVVDFFYGCTDPAYLGGGSVGDAVDHAARLLPVARAAGAPVIYTVTQYRPDGSDAGWFGVKVPLLKLLQEGSKAVEIDSRVAPDPADHVIVKKMASAFFGTPLAGLLTSLARDSLIVAGCTTSGCVRASVVDACSSGYRVVVPRQCVGDRAPGPHEASLFDMDAKYADVVETADVLRYLEGLHA